jgi:hypothetical protein
VQRMRINDRWITIYPNSLYLSRLCIHSGYSCFRVRISGHGVVIRRGKVSVYYVYIYIHVCICAFMCFHIRNLGLDVFKLTYLYMYIYMYIYINMYICMHQGKGWISHWENWVYTCVYERYENVYVYIYIHRYIHICICIVAEMYYKYNIL